uniref:Retrotransposon gag domain-containing protein n=1 Tax=Tanacetum cinerariifolium TaxID=118510 RepID=A0A6L2N4P4_TANCI|nr:hypothetical protein [Tanacetum cinerariifolium]
MGDDVDINTLTMEQYMSLIQDNVRQGIVKPEISNDIKFEINGNFMREFRRKLFKGTDEEDAQEHVRRVLEIVDFSTSMPLSAGLITIWDLLEEAFITKYCPPFKTAMNLEKIRNFKQEIDETLYHAWEKERVKEETKMGKKDMKEPVPRYLPVVQPYKAKEDEGGMDDGWDITIKDVERLRKILTPTIHTLPNLELVVQPYMPRGPVRDEVKVVRGEELEYDILIQNSVMQPLTPQTVHIISPDDDDVVPATNPILDKHLNGFGKEFFI